MNPLMKDIKKVLLSPDEIGAKVAELGRKITSDYQNKNLVMICVLKGAAPFFTDLFRNVELPVSCDFIAVSSYGSATSSSGSVCLIKDVDCCIEGMDVIIVEDIVDTGLTLKYLCETFAERGARSVKTCTLLDKPSRRKADIAPDYCGFTVADEFVVGYGLDFGGKYRNLKEVCVLKEEVYEK